MCCKPRDYGVGTNNSAKLWYLCKILKRLNFTMFSAGHIARMEEGRSAFKILTGEPKGKNLLGRSRRRRGDNIRIDLK